MVFREENVRRGLAELRTIASELAKYPDVGVDDLRQDLSLRWTVERGVLAGLSVIFNIGDHILVSLFERHPTHYEDTLTELQGVGVVPADVRERLSGAGGFRNILVHEYVEIDLDEVARVCASAAETYRAFAREIERWLERRDESGR